MAKFTENSRTCLIHFWQNCHTKETKIFCYRFPKSLRVKKKKAISNLGGFSLSVNRISSLKILIIDTSKQFYSHFAI